MPRLSIRSRASILRSRARGRASTSLVVLGALACACADKGGPQAAALLGDAAALLPRRAEPAEASGAAVASELAGGQSASPLSRQPAVTVKAPARGCALVEDRPLREDAWQAWVSSSIQGDQALVLRSDRRTLERWQLLSPPRLLTTFVHGQPIARLAVLRGTNLAVGFVDDKGDVWLLREPLSKPQRLAQGADRRFAPALAQVAEQQLLAFTRTVDGAMHTFVVRSAKPEPIDVTPAGHGASAASFVLGVTPPVLVMLDARAGISPLLEVPFDAQGVPGPAIVRTPVSMPYAPPLLAAVQVPAGELEVAFSAIGKLAATAVGRVPLRRAVGPVALHPSRGYGELSFDVALTAKAALFALEVPSGEVPSGEATGAAHGIELKWLDAEGEGQTMPIPTTGSARAPSLVASATPGQLVLTYTAQSRAHAARVVCDY